MKVKRQSKILEIIKSQAIETQDDLIAALEKSGFAVTQATVSRDIKELRLIKTLDHNGSYRYTAVKADNEHISGKFHSIFQDAVRSIDFAGNLVVVKCLSGMAQAACAAMDALHFDSVVGTLGGDDTFVCITKNSEDAIGLVEELQKLQRQGE